MEIFEGLPTAIGQFGQLSVLIAFALGLANGMIFGILPGLSGSVGIALMIPLTYGMGAGEAMTLFVAALSGQTFAGSISAILLNTPGTSPNAATTFDGYPLARAGRGGFAIGISAGASAMGSVVGVLVLVALFPVMRSVILAFSFPEFAMLGLVGIMAIALASRGSLAKGLIAGAVGLLLSFVGFAPVGGDIRYVFGNRELVSGIDVIAVLIGLFALPEVVKLLSSRERIATDVDALRFGRRQVWEGVRYVFSQPLLLIRSSLLGTGIGIIPAVGGTVASFLAYFQASKTCKNGNFGNGDPRGVLAPEAANDGKDAGAALPSLAFGLPGSSDWAIILGAMIIHGIQPGPNLIRENPEIVWTAVLVILAASFLSSAIGILFAPTLVQITRARTTLLAPVVAVLAVVGSYALEQQIFDVYVAVAFGLLGYAMRQLGMPAVPLILGLLLGETVERSFLQSLSVFGGPSVFVTRPVSLGLLLIAVALVAGELIGASRRRRRGGAVEQAAVERATRPASLALVGGLGLVGVVGVSLAYDFSEDSRLFPFIVGWLLVILAVSYLAIALVPGLRSRFGVLIADTGTMEQVAAQAAKGDGDGDGVGRVVESKTGTGVEESIATAGPSGPVTARATPSADPAPGPVAPAPTLADDRAEERARGRRVLATMGLLVAFALVTALVGVAVAVPVFLLLAVRFVGQEGWRATAILTVGTSAVLYLAFVQLLGVPLGEGLLLS